MLDRDPARLPARDHAARRRVLVQRSVHHRRRRPAPSGHGVRGAGVPRRHGRSRSPTTFGHYQDIGGLRAGSISPHATEIYHEGVLVPPVRIVREGQLNEEAYRIFLRNSRLPEHRRGRHARDDGVLPPRRDRGSTELFARYGAATVLAAFDAVHRADRRAGARAVPRPDARGRSGRFHDFLDSDGGADARPYRVELTLSRRGDHVRLDGSALRRPGARPDQLHDEPGTPADRVRALSPVARPRPRRERRASRGTSTSGSRARAASSSRAFPPRSACARTPASA